MADVDLIMSYWAGEAIAYTIVSFGFDDGARLASSIETRKESHERYSSVVGLFKQHELAVVAADERDVVRVRGNVRGEDVRIYHLRMTPENAQVLLRKYVERTGVCDSRVCSWVRSLPIFRQQLDPTDEKALALFSLLTETIEIDR